MVRFINLTHYSHSHSERKEAELELHMLWPLSQGPFSNIQTLSCVQRQQLTYSATIYFS